MPTQSEQGPPTTAAAVGVAMSDGDRPDLAAMLARVLTPGGRVVSLVRTTAFESAWADLVSHLRSLPR